MKCFRTLGIVALIVLVVAGCTQMTPRSRLYMVEVSYQAATQATIDYLTSGHELTEKQAEELLLFHEMAQKAMVAYRASVLSGKPSEQAFRDFQVALDGILREQAGLGVDDGR